MVFCKATFLLIYINSNEEFGKFNIEGDSQDIEP